MVTHETVQLVWAIWGYVALGTAIVFAARTLRDYEAKTQAIAEKGRSLAAYVEAVEGLRSEHRHLRAEHDALVSALNKATRAAEMLPAALERLEAVAKEHEARLAFIETAKAAKATEPPRTVVPYFARSKQ